MCQQPENIAVIAVSEAGLHTAHRLIDSGMKATLYAAQEAASKYPAKLNYHIFDDGIIALTEKIFSIYNGLVFIMPVGIVVRAIAPLAKDKHTDPAVVTVDVGGRWAVSTLSGHEGGANRLANDVAACLHCEPVITTSTDATKTLIAGVGCGKGVSSGDIEAAMVHALNSIDCSVRDLRLVTTVDAKQNEEGLLIFCESHDLPLRIISREEIRCARIQCAKSEFVKMTLGIDAVAEPCALLGGSKTELILEKQIYNKITIAIAAERLEW
jgi:cobalt-precorrin 5A hydrolase